MVCLAICSERYLSALMRWECEWWRSITDVENLVFPWHRHTVSEIVVHVKVLVDSDQRSVIGSQLTQMTWIARILVIVDSGVFSYAIILRSSSNNTLKHL